MKKELYTLSRKIRHIFLVITVLLVSGMVKHSVNARITATTNNPQTVAVQPSRRTLPLDQAPSIAQPVVEPFSSNIQPVGKLSLEQIHALSEQERAVASAKGATRITSDRFTQSQAHMSLPEIKKIIAAEYNTKPYEKMITAMLDHEKQYKDDYYVFYHGMKNIWRVPQDLYTRLYFYFKKLPADLMKSFIFLRFTDVSGPPSIQNFLINKLKDNGLINDHELGDFLYSVNVAIFGNVGTEPECTWQYFVKSRGKSAPDRATYEKILDSFGLSHKYIDQLMALVDLYATAEQTIVQIFIPKGKIDEIGYLSWIRGIPAHKKTMDMVLRSVEDKTFSKSPLALDHYTALFKREQEKNPLFKNLIERVKAEDFRLGYFLQFYRNRPEAIEGINNFQARLVFTPGLLLNPLSGVKVFRYSAATPEQLKKYEQKFDNIFKKIIAEKEASKR